MPSAFNVTVPPSVVAIVCGAVAIAPAASEIEIKFPSGSVSLLSTLLVIDESVSKTKISSVAIGGALLNVVGSVGSTGAFMSRTSIDTVAVSVLPNVSVTV